MSRTWIKLFTEALWDPKLRTTPPAHRWCFVGLLLLAGQCDDGNNGGRLEVAAGVPMAEEAIADALGVPADAWDSARDALMARGMIRRDDATIIVTNYASRQAPKDRTAAERMERYRSKHRNTARNVTGGVTGDVTRTLRVEAEAESTPTIVGEHAPTEAGKWTCPNITQAQARKVIATLCQVPGWKADDREDLKLVIVSANLAHQQAPTVSPASLLQTAANELLLAGGQDKDGKSYPDIRRAFRSYVGFQIRRAGEAPNRAEPVSRSEPTLAQVLAEQRAYEARRQAALNKGKAAAAARRAKEGAADEPG